MPARDSCVFFFEASWTPRRLFKPLQTDFHRLQLMIIQLFVSGKAALPDLREEIQDLLPVFLKEEERRARHFDGIEHIPFDLIA